MFRTSLTGLGKNTKDQVAGEVQRLSSATFNILGADVALKALLSSTYLCSSLNIRVDVLEEQKNG
jgi:hypothetical protein